jgi:hypothetical protein
MKFKNISLRLIKVFNKKLQQGAVSNIKQQDDRECGQVLFR